MTSSHTYTEDQLRRAIRLNRAVLLAIAPLG